MLSVPRTPLLIIKQAVNEATLTRPIVSRYKGVEDMDVHTKQVNRKGYPKSRDQIQ